MPGRNGKVKVNEVVEVQGVEVAVELLIIMDEDGGGGGGELR